MTGLQGVPTDQRGSLRFQCRLQASQGLAQQLGLQRAGQGRNGDHRLGTGHHGSASPEVGAGMQSGQPGVSPRVAEQSWKAIDALKPA